MPKSSAPDLAKDQALAFIKSYACDHQFFTGGDVLAAFREAKVPGAEQDWRNRWGALISACARQGWLVKAGRVAPSSSQSHTATLVQWQSRLFTGVPALVGTTMADQLEAIRKDFVLRKVDLRTALQRAYDLGSEDSNA